MFVTIDILQKRGACQKYLDFFAKHYPNGAETAEIVKIGHMPYHIYHWAYENLDPTPEDVEIYWKKVCVENSQGVYGSDHIYNSTLISESSKVDNSESVYRSKEINNSTYIADSEFVDNSKQVGISSFVDNCERVIKSKNITNSKEIYESEYIINSDGIFKSDNVVESHGIWHSNNVTNCCFCANCKDLSNAIFCQDMEGGEYMLFNKPIDKVRFDMINKQFLRYKPEITLTSEWQNNFGDLPCGHLDYRKHFEKIEESFWVWAHTLPGYNAHILYSLTFNPIFLS